MSTCFYMFFSTHPAPTEIYTLSLHDALPICLLDLRCAAIGPEQNAHTHRLAGRSLSFFKPGTFDGEGLAAGNAVDMRSEEHTSELQSRRDLVCRLLLEKKKTTRNESDAAAV